MFMLGSIMSRTRIIKTKMIKEGTGFRIICPTCQSKCVIAPSGYTKHIVFCQNGHHFHVDSILPAIPIDL